MTPTVRNVVACAILRHMDNFPSTRFNALIDVAFNRKVDLTDPDLRSQLGLARKKLGLYPTSASLKRSKKARRRRRTNEPITHTVDEHGSEST